MGRADGRSRREAGIVAPIQQIFPRCDGRELFGQPLAQAHLQRCVAGQPVGVQIVLELEAKAAQSAADEGPVAIPGQGGVAGLFWHLRNELAIGEAAFRVQPGGVAAKIAPTPGYGHLHAAGQGIAHVLPLPGGKRRGRADGDVGDEISHRRAEECH